MRKNFVYQSKLISTNSGDYFALSFQQLHQDLVNVNPLYANRFFLLVLYNKLGIVHCTYLGVSGCDLKKKYVVF